MTASPLRPGREADEAIHTRVFGLSLEVPRPRALAMLGAFYTVATGPTFEVEVGRGADAHRVKVRMPHGETLGGDPSDDNYNQRYFRYVAQHLLDFPNEIGERVASDLAAIRATPKPYSDDLATAWLVVEAVQRRFPGWRFMLLGGDESYAYRRGMAGEPDYVAVPSAPREVFGWRASFFGHIDPTENSGQRHADEWAETPALAICLAALAALDSSSPAKAAVSDPRETERREANDA